MLSFKKYLIITCIITILKILIFELLLFYPTKTEVYDVAQNLFNEGEMYYFIHGQKNYNYQFPIYPLLLFPFFFLKNAINGIVLLQILISTFTAISLVVFFRLFIKYYALYYKTPQVKRIIYFLGIVFQFFPFNLYYTYFYIHPFVWDQFLFFTTLSGAYYYLLKRNQFAGVLFCVLLGLSTINRNTLFFVFFIMLFELPIYQYWKKMLLCLCIVLIPFFIWNLRNYIIYGEISNISSSGQNVWIGIIEESGGTTNISSSQNYFSTLSEQEWKQVHSYNPPGQSRYFFHKYIYKIKHSGLLFFKMYLIKLKNFWLYPKSIGIEYPDVIVKYIFLYKSYCLVLLAILCYIVLIGRYKILFTLLIYPIILSIIQAFIYIETRHRMLVEPIFWFFIISSFYVSYSKNYKI